MIKKELAPGIVVYREIGNNLEEWLRIIKNSESKNTLYLNPTLEDVQKNWPLFEPNFDDDGRISHTAGWHEWHNIGIKTNFFNLFLEPNDDESKKEKEFINQGINTYKKVFIDYLSDSNNKRFYPPYIDFNYDSENWLKVPPNIFKYNIYESEKENQNMALGWHVDAYPDSLGNHACYKRTIAGNYYLTDNYEEGEIVFLCGNDMTSLYNKENLKIVYYKPQAGDLVIYPAAHPGAHAVKRPKGNPRYALNAFLDWEYDGSMKDSLNKYIIWEDDGVTPRYNFWDWVRDVPEEKHIHIDGKSFFKDAHV